MTRKSCKEALPAPTGSLRGLLGCCSVGDSRTCLLFGMPSLCVLFSLLGACRYFRTATNQTVRRGVARHLADKKASAESQEKEKEAMRLLLPWEQAASEQGNEAGQAGCVYRG